MTRSLLVRISRLRLSSRLLLSYFSSGWVFLVPYVLTYITYYLLKWPVNPGPYATDADVQLIFPTGVPPLLHVFWALHAINLLLGTIALRTWWRSTRHSAGNESPGASKPSTPMDLLRQKAAASFPWCLLALLFWIPGVYMEFPTDPWQHYARINEWSWHDLVGQHSYWKKSSYFLGYSLIGHITPPLLQIKWFNLYYTACCLLLCWQYYKLARTASLGPRGAFCFVLLNSLVSGNHMFGFYRIYGMSSTVFAQLGAVALTRIALVAAREGRISAHLSLLLQSVRLWFTGTQTRQENDGATVSASGSLPFLSPTLQKVVRFFLLAASGCLLLILTAFNHVQGVGIAAIGLLAVAIWRLIEWKRSMIGVIALLAIALSVAMVTWYPRHPLLDSFYRPSGWLASWYGFNFFTPSSPGFQRGWMIPGALGALDLLAGVFLLRRNHVVGWLALMPYLLLSLPLVSIPFASVLAANDGYIIVYHRMLLAAPAGLALVTLAQAAFSFQHAAWWPQPVARWLSFSRVNSWLKPTTSTGSLLCVVQSPLPILLLALLTVLACGAPYYSRVYHALMVPPNDLAMKPVLTSPMAVELHGSKPSYRLAPDPWLEQRARARVIATPGIAYVLNATGATKIPSARKNITWPWTILPSEYTQRLLDNLAHQDPQKLQRALFVSVDSIFTPLSTTAVLSGYWAPNEVALSYATYSEMAAEQTLGNKAPQFYIEWISPRDQTKFYSRTATPPPETDSSIDFGRVNTGRGNQMLQTGDRLIFRVVARSHGNRIRRLMLNIAKQPRWGLTAEGPIVSADYLQWITAKAAIDTLPTGRSDLEIIAHLIDPQQTVAIRLHFIAQPAP